MSHQLYADESQVLFRCINTSCFNKTTGIMSKGRLGNSKLKPNPSKIKLGGGPGVVVSTAAFHARVRGSVPGLGGFKEAKMFLPHPRVKVSIVGSLCDREVACSASDRQGSNFESCVWRTVSSHLLTILRRFSWPSLAYMCTKVA